MKMFLFLFLLTFHWSLFPRVQLTIISIGWQQTDDMPLSALMVAWFTLRIYTLLGLNGLIFQVLEYSLSAWLLKHWLHVSAGAGLLTWINFNPSMD